MKKLLSGLLLGMGLLLAQARALPAAEEVLEVDLGQPEATATPLPPTPVPTATEAPTAAPTPLPTEAATAGTELPAPTASPTPGAREDLDKVRFDAAGEGAEDGLMIIAPGAASPEDSLESFGIDSPFNWKSRERKLLKPGQEQDAEALELGAPETSDLRERVRVETGQGDALPSDGDYDHVERAGVVLGAQEYRVDGRIARTANGAVVATRGGIVALRMEPGRQIYPGSVYTAFRDGGLLRGSGASAEDVGMLVQNTGVLKVVRIEGEEVLAKVERQYETVREGDLVRLRDPERLRYYNALRQGGGPPVEVKGEVLAVKYPKLVGRRGDIVYLNVGKKHGAFPGLRLLLSREPAPLAESLEGQRSIRNTGRLGQVEVINVSREASTARVVRAMGEVRVGDQVRFR